MNGSYMRKTYDYVRYFDTHSPEECKKLQDAALKRILDIAVRNSPFYREQIAALHLDREPVLDDFKVLKKCDLIDNFNQILVPIDKIEGQEGYKLEEHHTTGSTGAPMSIKLSRQKVIHRICELKYHSWTEGFKSHELMLTVHSMRPSFKNPNGDNALFGLRYEKEHNIMKINIRKLDDEAMDVVYRTIVKEHVVMIRGYVGIIVALAKYVVKKKLPAPGLKLASCTGEMLQDDKRKLIKEALKCETCSMYALEELGLIALDIVPTKAESNEMRMNHSGYIFEVLALDSDTPVELNTPGRLVVTDLFNNAFPLIRYDIGDIVVLKEGDERTSGWPMVARIDGRVYDILTDTEGNDVHPNAIPKSFQDVNYIDRWQFVQLSADEYEIRLDNAKACDVDTLLGYFRATFGRDAKITVKAVDEIPTLPSGKTKLIINESILVK